MTIHISHIDHIVMTVADIDTTIEFYQHVLDINSITFKQTRKALKLDNQKINLHLYGQEVESLAHLPKPGTLDLCFITQQSIRDPDKNLIEISNQI